MLILKDMLYNLIKNVSIMLDKKVEIDLVMRFCDGES